MMGSEYMRWTRLHKNGWSYEKNGSIFPGEPKINWQNEMNSANQKTSENTSKIPWPSDLL